ncbi:hypothetical protein F5887DRAFT_950375 [Amanita rubescens]|nr:hypothetical protein F5887DRAFT_950375 [Amanita rubescens]
MITLPPTIYVGRIARFGATPVPGRFGMAMAGQGLLAAPQPRSPANNYFVTRAAGSTSKTRVSCALILVPRLIITL